MTIVINGVPASYDDLKALLKAVAENKDAIKSIRTSATRIAIKTA